MVANIMGVSSAAMEVSPTTEKLVAVVMVVMVVSVSAVVSVP